MSHLEEQSAEINMMSHDSHALNQQKREMPLMDLSNSTRDSLSDEE